MVIGRYCTAFTDTGRVFYIYIYIFFILSVEISNDGSIDGSGSDGGGVGDEERGVT